MFCSLVKQVSKKTFVRIRLVNYAKRHLDDQVTIDYFAVSLPDLTIWEDDLNKRNKTHCVYMQGLGHLGLKQIDNAGKAFAEVLIIEKSHLGVVIHQKLLEELKENQYRN